MTLFALLFSFVAFLPLDDGEGYFNIHVHAFIWHFLFLFGFITVAITDFEYKLIAKLTEGITLIQSLAIVYLVLDYGLFLINNFSIKILLFAGILLSVFSLIHSITNIKLSKPSRFFLSIWSTVIMVLFALDNIFRVYLNDQIEGGSGILNELFISVQYFLLGVSAMYLVQNLSMIAGLFRVILGMVSRTDYLEFIELKKKHIKRYSDGNVKVVHSFLCLLIVGFVFSINYYFRIIPSHMAVWIMFIIFPMILNLFDGIGLKKNYR